VGLLGLSFKADTDDLRGSPMVAVAENLLARGYDVRIYDPSLNLSRLIGANAAEMKRRMPHLESLLKQEVSEVIEHADLVIASQKCAPMEVLKPLVRPNQQVIDVNGWRELKSLPWGYEGLCWS
jgi:GDP-mannose 6-dehydrogenase